MARIRTIKPSFFTSLPISGLAFDTRLTFIGLWTHCDDEGRCVYEPRLIKAALWPLDDSVTSKRVAAMIEEMELAELVQTYEVDGGEFLQVVGFQEHQRISKPQASKLPNPPQPLRDCSAPIPQLVDAGREGKGREQGKEEEGKGSVAAAALAERFENEEHRTAFLAYRRTHTMPDGFDATLRSCNTGMSGARAFDWPVIGQALLEMRGASVAFSAQALRRFCEKLVQGTASDESPAQRSVREALARKRQEVA